MWSAKNGTPQIHVNLLVSNANRVPSHATLQFSSLYTAAQICARNTLHWYLNVKMAFPTRRVPTNATASTVKHWSMIQLKLHLGLLQGPPLAKCILSSPRLYCTQLQLRNVCETQHAYFNTTKLTTQQVREDTLRNFRRQDILKYYCISLVKLSVNWLVSCIKLH